MTIKNRKTIVPLRESELAKAVDGDIVKISIASSKGSRGILTIYKGTQDGVDRFVGSKLIGANQTPVIELYASRRTAQRYDPRTNNGVILSRQGMHVKFVGPGSAEYQSYERELREAGLWERN